MDDWVLALIGVSLLACICICGELATWVKEDDDKTKGFKKTTSKKTYMGAPMRMTFSGFDLPEKKRRAREMAHLDMPGLDLSGGHGMLPGATMADINLTPRDADGTPRLMSARELAEISQGQYVSQREKELESRDVESLSPEELGEMYTLQIKSAAQEVAVRDRHLEILKQNVDEARVAALEQHEEAVALAIQAGYTGELESPGSERSVQLPMSTTDMDEETSPLASPLSSRANSTEPTLRAGGGGTDSGDAHYIAGLPPPASPTLPLPSLASERDIPGAMP